MNSDSSPIQRRKFSNLTTYVRGVALLSVVVSVGTAAVMMLQTKTLLEYFHRTVNAHQQVSRRAMEQAKNRSEEWRSKFTGFKELLHKTLEEQSHKILLTNSLHWTYRISCIYDPDACDTTLRHVYLEPGRWIITDKLTGSEFLNYIKEIRHKNPEKLYSAMISSFSATQKKSDPLDRILSPDKYDASTSVLYHLILKTDLYTRSSRIRILKLMPPVKDRDGYYTVHNRIVYDNQDPMAIGKILRKDDILRPVVDNTTYLKYMSYFQYGISKGQTTFSPILIAFSVQKASSGGSIDPYTFKGRRYIFIIPVASSPYAVTLEINLQRLVGHLWDTLSETLNREFLSQLHAITLRFDEILHGSMDKYVSIHKRIEKMRMSSYAMMGLSTGLIILFVLLLYMLISHYVLRDLPLLDDLFELAARYSEEKSGRRRLAIEQELMDLDIGDSTPLAQMSAFVQNMMLELMDLNKKYDDLAGRHEYLNKGISELADDIMEITVKDLWDHEFKGEPTVLTVPLRSLFNKFRRELYDIKEENQSIESGIRQLGKLLTQLMQSARQEEVDTLLNSSLAVTSEMEEHLDGLDTTFEHLLDDYKNLHVVVSNIVLEGTKQRHSGGLQEIFDHINQTYDKLESSHSDVRKTISEMRRALGELKSFIERFRNHLNHVRRLEEDALGRLDSIHQHSQSLMKKMQVFRVTAMHDERFEKRLYDTLEQVKITLSTLRDVVSERGGRETESLGRMTNDYITSIHGMMEQLENRLSHGNVPEAPLLVGGTISEIMEAHPEEGSPFLEERSGDDDGDTD